MVATYFYTLQSQRSPNRRSSIACLAIHIGARHFSRFTAFHEGWCQGGECSLFFPPVGPALRRFIDPLLRDWLILALLWLAIPPWQPRPTLPTAPLWEFVYAVVGAAAVMIVGMLLLRSAYARRAQIKEFRQEMQREAWRQQARAAQGLAPDDRGSTTVITQATWNRYAAPPEPWSQTIRGILILGLIIAVVGGLIVAFIQLYAEYSYFQGRWPSSRH